MPVDFFEDGTKQAHPPKKGVSSTPILDNFSRDLSKLADEGKLDPVIGRDKEIRRIAQILSRKKKNNVVVVGDSGVGKCISGDMLITIRDNTNNKVYKISIDRLFKIG